MKYMGIRIVSIGYLTNYDKYARITLDSSISSASGPYFASNPIFLHVFGLPFVFAHCVQV